MQNMEIKFNMRSAFCRMTILNVRTMPECYRSNALNSKYPPSRLQHTIFVLSGWTSSPHSMKRLANLREDKFQLFLCTYSNARWCDPHTVQTWSSVSALASTDRTHSENIGLPTVDSLHRIVGCQHSALALLLDYSSKGLLTSDQHDEQPSASNCDRQCRKNSQYPDQWHKDALDNVSKPQLRRRSWGPRLDVATFWNL
jgi:hypothetical protein